MNAGVQNMNEGIVEKLKSELTAAHVDLVDNSWMHAGHEGAAGGSHIALTIVSDQFEGLNLLDRHRMVHKTLRPEMEQSIHALELKTLTPAEWEQN